MQGEIKTIKVWVPPEDRDHVLGLNLAGKSLRINTTMKAEYNRKMMVIDSICVGEAENQRLAEDKKLLLILLNPNRNKQVGLNTPIVPKAISKSIQQFNAEERNVEIIERGPDK